MRSGRQRVSESTQSQRRDSKDETLESKKITDELRTYMTEMRESMKTLNGKMSLMNNTLDQLKLETLKNRKEIEQNKKEIQKLQFQSYTNSRDIEQQNDELALIEQRQVDTWLRIKNLDITEINNIHEKIIEILANLTEKSANKLNEEINKIYKINRTQEENKKRPADIIVQFLKQTSRDEVMEVYNRKGLVWNGSGVIFLREVPGRILRRRKDYDLITTILKQNAIRFRWERLEGISLTFKGKRFKLNSLEKAKDFLDRYKLELTAHPKRKQKINGCKERGKTRPNKDEEEQSNQQGRNVSADGVSYILVPAERQGKTCNKGDNEELDDDDDESLKGAVGGSIENAIENMRGGIGEEELLFEFQEMDLECPQLTEK